MPCRTPLVLTGAPPRARGSPTIVQEKPPVPRFRALAFDLAARLASSSLSNGSPSVSMAEA